MHHELLKLIKNSPKLPRKDQHTKTNSLYMPTSRKYSFLKKVSFTTPSASIIH